MYMGKMCYSPLAVHLPWALGRLHMATLLSNRPPQIGAYPILTHHASTQSYSEAVDGESA